MKVEAFDVYRPTREPQRPNPGRFVELSDEDAKKILEELDQKRGKLAPDQPNSQPEAPRS